MRLTDVRVWMIAGVAVVTAFLCTVLALQRGRGDDAWAAFLAGMSAELLLFIAYASAFNGHA